MKEHYGKLTPFLEGVAADVTRFTPHTTFQDAKWMLGENLDFAICRMQDGQTFTFHGKTITLDNIWRDWLVEVANRLDASSECWDLLCRYHPDLQNSSNEELLRKFNEACKK